jgi:hypothetical protein
MLLWSNPFPIYDATYVFRVYPRDRTTQFNAYTTFFWGNNGDFRWDGGEPNTYYGAHPYPTPAPSGPGQWEISVNSNDYVTGSEIVWDRWYTQAFRAWRESPNVTHHDFYWDLPDTTRVIRGRVDNADWAKQNPPDPAIVMGQAPDLNGASWGGYPGWEEFNGIIRGIQIYSGFLSIDEILLETTMPMSTSSGQDHIWYLNLDPRPLDVSDKKGTGTPHDPQWDGEPALEWTGPTGGPVTGVLSPEIRAASILRQNRPNPFNPTTTVDFVMPVTGKARLVIYDVSGRRIRTLLDEERRAGVNSASWDGRDDRGHEVTSGVYLARLEKPWLTPIIKMALVR